MGFFIYRYLICDEVIYIGKTKRDLKKRIDEHKLERKFMPYLAKAKIEYYETATEVEMDIHEKYWINVYMPKLNVVDKEGAKFSFSIEDNVIWKSYDSYSERKKDFLLGEPNNKLSLKEKEFQRLEEKLQLYYNAEEYVQYLFESILDEQAEYDGTYYSVTWDLDLYAFTDGIALYTRASYDNKKKEYRLFIHKSLAKEIKSITKMNIKEKIKEIRGEELTKYIEFCT